MTSFPRVHEPWKTVSFLVLCTFIWGGLYAHRGYSGRDEGLIASFAWRVTQGEIPYRDFTCPLPPLTILLRALVQRVVPLDWVMLAERYLYFTIIAGYCWIAAHTIDRTFRLRTMGLGVPLLALACFVASAGNFPPMSWHTVDGVFFGAVGFALLTRGGASRACLGAASLFCSLLCKQSFLFAVIAGAMYLAWNRQRRGLVAYLLTMLVCGLGFVGLLGWTGLLGEFAAQIRLQTSLSSLLRSGGLSYLRFHALAVVPWLGISLVYAWIARTFRPSWFRWTPFLFVCGVIATDAGFHLAFQRFQTPVFNYLGFLFLVVAALTLYFLRGERQRTLLLLLTLSWCASLSWGYQTPSFFALPIVFGFLWFCRSLFGTPAGPLALAVLVASAGAQYVGYLHPFGEPPGAVLDRPLSTAFSRLSGLRSSPRRVAKYSELNELHRDYGDNYVVYPAMPLTHFLTNSAPTARTDWAIDPRSDYRVDDVMGLLERNHTMVFLEIESPYRCRPGRSCSALVREVEQRWRLVERREFFDVYERPEPGC